MSKQSKSSASKDVKEVPIVTTPVVEEPQKVSRKKKVEPVPTPVPAPVAETAKSAVETAPVVGDQVEEVAVTKRRQVTRDDVEKDFDTLLQSLDEEIETIRKNEDKNKSKGVRFLRAVYKRVRQLRSDSLRVASKKVRRASSTTTVNSGFMKPVKISSAMQKFTGLKEDQLVSRVDVTKSICQYVKEKNLQNQADRRQFTPDEKLAKLLGTDQPLTYYALQQQIQPHFVK